MNGTSFPVAMAELLLLASGPGRKIRARRNDFPCHDYNHGGNEGVLLFFCPFSMSSGNVIVRPFLEKIMALTQRQFEDAVRRYGPVLRRCLLKLTSNHPQDADDLLQRTFECAWRKRAEFQDGALDAWLFTIARYLHLTTLRSYARAERLKDALSEELPSFVNSPSDAWATSQAVRKCLERLEPLSRRIVELFYGREAMQDPSERITPPYEAAGPLTDAEIAAYLKRGDSREWTTSAVSKRRGRALAHLAQCLEHREGGAMAHQMGGARASAAAVGQNLAADEPASASGRSLSVAVKEEAPLPRLRLASLAVAPDEPTLAALRAEVLKNRDSLARLEQMYCVELALLSDVWERARGGETRAPPLPPALKRRLLALPLKERDRVRALRPWAAAALVLLAISLWQWPSRQLSREEDGRGEGGTSGRGPQAPEPSALESADLSEKEAASSPPLRLIRQDGRTSAVTGAELTYLGQNRYRAMAQAKDWIQLRVGRPATVPFGTTWSASATLHKKSGGVLHPLELSPLSAIADSTALEVIVGPAVDLSGLRALGFGQDDTLVFLVVRGEETFSLEVELPLGAER